MKEFPGSLFYYAVQFSQNFQTKISDVGPDHPAVLKVALLAEKRLRLQSGEEPGDIRFGRNHHASDRGTDQAGGSCGSQDSQDIVLRDGESGGLQPLLHCAMQAVGGAHEVEQRLFVGTGEALGLLGSLGVSCHLVS